MFNLVPIKSALMIIQPILVTNGLHTIQELNEKFISFEQIKYNKKKRWKFKT